MPAQQLTERSKDRIVSHMGLPANSSTAALMKKVDKEDGGLDVEFKAGTGATSGHVSTRQWITVAVLVYVNLINYMDRLTIAGKKFNIHLFTRPAVPKASNCKVSVQNLSWSDQSHL